MIPTTPASDVVVNIVLDILLDVVVAINISRVWFNIVALNMCLLAITVVLLSNSVPIRVCLSTALDIVVSVSVDFGPTAIAVVPGREDRIGLLVEHVKYLDSHSICTSQGQRLPQYLLVLGVVVILNLAILASEKKKLNTVLQ